MLNLEEALVARYLTAGGRVLIAPQFAINYNPELNEGGSEPDFIAVDLMSKGVAIVEVTVAYNLSNLMERLRNREAGWIAPLRRHFSSVFGPDWNSPIRVLCFVRKARLEYCDKQALGPDVDFYAIEDASFPWEYWDSRQNVGLPAPRTSRLLKKSLVPVVSA